MFMLILNHNCADSTLESQNTKSWIGLHTDSIQRGIESQNTKLSSLSTVQAQITSTNSIDSQPGDCRYLIQS